MGAIAAANTPESAALFHSIMLASASIPGASSPVMIDVEVDGKHFQEMHVDGGTMAFEYEKELALVENARDLLRKDNYAEHVIKKGNYGVCESCGVAIPIARLEVLPYATMCVDCSGKR